MTATKTPSVRGFFGAVVLFRSKLLGWDLGLALVAAVGALFLPSADKDLLALASSFAPTAIGLAASLVGVVVAALAVVVVFFDEDFLIVIDTATKARGGIEGQLFPYWFVCATGVGAILASVALMLLLGTAPIPVVRALFVVTIALMVWTAVGIFNLVASIQALGTSRAIYAAAKKRERH